VAGRWQWLADYGGDDGTIWGLEFGMVGFGYLDWALGLGYAFGPLLALYGFTSFMIFMFSNK
jgi:hypothetical protein